MVIFHCYVSLPEGIYNYIYIYTCTYKRHDRNLPKNLAPDGPGLRMDGTRFTQDVVVIPMGWMSILHGFYVFSMAHMKKYVK